MPSHAIADARDYLAQAYKDVSAELENGQLEDASIARAADIACAALQRAVNDSQLWIELTEALSAAPDGPMIPPNLGAFVEQERMLFQSAGLPVQVAQDLAELTVLHLRAATEHPSATQFELVRGDVRRAAQAVCGYASALHQTALAPAPGRGLIARIKRAAPVIKAVTCVGGLLVVAADAVALVPTAGHSMPSISAGLQMIAAG